MRFLLHITLIFILLAELSLADSTLNWETKPFLVYIGVLLITLFGIWGTKSKH